MLLNVVECLADVFDHLSARVRAVWVIEVSECFRQAYESFLDFSA